MAIPVKSNLKVGKIVSSRSTGYPYIELGTDSSDKLTLSTTGSWDIDGGSSGRLKSTGQLYMESQGGINMNGTSSIQLGARDIYIGQDLPTTKIYLKGTNISDIFESDGKAVKVASNSNKKGNIYSNFNALCQKFNKYEPYSFNKITNDQFSPYNMTKILFFKGRYFYSNVSILYSDDIYNWTFIDNRSLGNNIKVIDDKIFIYGGNKVSYSNTGIDNWNTATIPEITTIYGIEKLNNKYFIKTNYYVWVSDDLINWIKLTSGPSSPLGIMRYVNGIYYIATSSTLYFSSDGLNFSNSSTPGYATSIIYASNKYIVISTSGIWSSVDGKTGWTAITTENQFRSSWNEVVKCNGVYFASAYSYGSSNGGVMFSEDGITWKRAYRPSSSEVLYGNFTDVVFLNGVYVIGYTEALGDFWWSTDKLNWTNVKYDSMTWDSIICENGLLVASSNSKNQGSNLGPNYGFAVSIDGKNWTRVALNGIWGAVTYGNGLFLSCGTDSSYGKTIAVMEPTYSLINDLQFSE